MATRDMPFRTNPLSHLVLLVSEARKGRPAARPTSRQAANGAPRAGLLERLDRWFWTQQLNERDAYLAQAQDHADLERRIRDLERHIPPRYY